MTNTNCCDTICPKCFDTKARERTQKAREDFKNYIKALTLSKTKFLQEAYDGVKVDCEQAL